MKILELLTPKRRIGNKGERIAIKTLKKKGCKILKKNYVAAGYEIDIICESRDTLSFVEVKTRTETEHTPWEVRPAASITPEKQRKIISAAKYFLATYNKSKHVSLDVIEVYLDKNMKTLKVVHMENAFNLNTAYNRKVIY
jgi:putative endonuclease